MVVTVKCECGSELDILDFYKLFVASNELTIEVKPCENCITRCEECEDAEKLQELQKAIRDGKLKPVEAAT